MTQGQRSDLSSSSGTSSNSNNYSDALDTQHQPNLSTVTTSPSASLPSKTAPISNPYEIPPPPPTRSRRNSALGTAAPAAAAFSYVNRPTVPSPLSSELRRDRSSSPPRRSRGISGPSPRRRSGGRYSFDAVHDPYGPGGLPDEFLYPDLSAQNIADLQPNKANANASGAEKAIVGDNGYPHMGIARRKSGGDYDIRTTGPLGPQVVAPPRLRSDDAGTRTTTMVSDDSTWRLSSGMPGGWRRERSSFDGGASPRNSWSYAWDSGTGDAGKTRRLRASDFTGTGEDTYAGQGVGQAL